MKKLFLKFWKFVKNVFAQLKDKTNIIIFVIVFAVLSSEVWVAYLLAFITRNNWFFAIGTACWAFWLGPFTPFLALCFALTFFVRKIIDKIKKNKQKKELPEDHSNDEDSNNDKKE